MKLAYNLLQFGPDLLQSPVEYNNTFVFDINNVLHLIHCDLHGSLMLKWFVNNDFNILVLANVCNCDDWWRHITVMTIKAINKDNFFTAVTNTNRWQFIF